MLLLSDFEFANAAAARHQSCHLSHSMKLELMSDVWLLLWRIRSWCVGRLFFLGFFLNASWMVAGMICVDPMRP
jgi:hypothetical protein